MKCEACGSPYKEITMELTVIGSLGKHTLIGCGICITARMLHAHNTAKQLNPNHAKIAEKMAENDNYSFEEMSDE